MRQISAARKPDIAYGDSRLGATERRKLERDLQQAAEQERFVLHYQPRYALGTGTLVGAEALLRWPDRKRGLIPPAAFLPITASSGLIGTIGGWVLRQACADARQWPGPLRISVNIAAPQLADDSLTLHIATALAAAELPPEQLEIELPEAVMKHKAIFSAPPCRSRL